MGLTTSPLCQLSRAGLRDRWLQPSPAEGPPQPTAVSTACPRGLLQARPAQPGPAPSRGPPRPLLPPSVSTPSSCPDWSLCQRPRVTWARIQLLCSQGRSRGQSAGSGRGRGAGEDWVCPWPHWPGDVSRPLTCDLGAGPQSASKAEVPGPAPSASPGNLLAVQILQPTADLQDRRVGPSYLCLSKPSRCLRWAPCWRTAGLDNL